MRTADLFKTLDRSFDDAQSVRLAREPEWQLIAEHFTPRKDFSIKGRPSELRKRRLTSSVPAVSLRRSAAMLAGFLVDTSQPFILPNAEMGLIRAGRMTGLGARDRDYLDAMGWAIHSHMMRPASGYLSSVSVVAVELLAFGTAIQWTRREPGFGPKYKARPLRSCWIAVDSDGQVDTLFYQFTMRLWEVLARFPEAKKVDGWDTSDEDKLRQEITLLHIVTPRAGGRKGAFKDNKPFGEYYVCRDKKVVLEEGGYDSFPFSVPRLEPEDGSPYGTGQAWPALPDAVALSTLQQGVENAVDLKVAPVTLTPARMFAKPLDRRPGANNVYDPSQLGFQTAKEAIQKLDMGGDVGIGDGYMNRLVQNIEMAMMTDWMRLREGSNVTAEEIRERRDLRLRTMSSFVPGVDRDLMGVAADRTVEIMFAEGRLPPPPQGLSGVEVEWDYGGPLAQAQMQRSADAFGRVLDMAQKAAAIDPTAPYVLVIEEGLRAVAEAYGQGAGVTRSREAVEALRARDAERQERQLAAQEAMAAAGALRDGAQGLASLANAGEPAANAA